MVARGWVVLKHVDERLVVERQNLKAAGKSKNYRKLKL